MAWARVRNGVGGRLGCGILMERVRSGLGSCGVVLHGLISGARAAAHIQPPSMYCMYCTLHTKRLANARPIQPTPRTHPYRFFVCLYENLFRVLHPRSLNNQPSIHPKPLRPSLHPAPTAFPPQKPPPSNPTP